MRYIFRGFLVALLAASADPILWAQARTLTVLYSFSGGADGAYPMAGLVTDKRGNLYGTTAYGGSFGHGTVFKLDPSGNETVLHSFTNTPDGAVPRLPFHAEPATNLRFRAARLSRFVRRDQTARGGGALGTYRRHVG